ncbi:DUF6053 domain-containing protein [Lysobacter enzymogenes]|uniref:DUF6053 domain-containing protein n=1 Tax=Lysobacter enzymogenes TaxID=69 RepID=UPI003CCE4671
MNRGRAFTVGGPSGPMLSAQVAASGTRASGLKALPQQALPQQALPGRQGLPGGLQLASTAGAAPAPLRSRRPTLCPTLAKNRMYR